MSLGVSVAVIEAILELRRFSLGSLNLCFQSLSFFTCVFRLSFSLVTHQLPDYKHKHSAALSCLLVLCCAAAMNGHTAALTPATD